MYVCRVSTHSRLKAAGKVKITDPPVSRVSTHSRLKAAGVTVDGKVYKNEVSTHSRLKAAGVLSSMFTTDTKFQHTAA